MTMAVSGDESECDALRFLLSELKSPLGEDVLASAADFLTSRCRQNGSTMDPSTLQNDCDQATSWLQWAHSHKHLKVVSTAIPVGILPSGYSGVLHDVKVFSRRGPDDEIYDENEELRQKVARGNCFLTLTTPSTTVTYNVIYALKKFTGGLGDDDDRDKGDDFTWKLYFTKPLDDCKLVVSTCKANGEAAHLSALQIGDELYLCAGSKNVHMIFCNKDDLEKYDKNNQRFSIAREICICILEKLGSMPLERRKFLTEFLAVARVTAVFEFLNPDHPHIEDLSDFQGPELRFITWTSLDLSSTTSSAQLCWLAPDVAIEVAKVFQLNTVNYSVIPVSEIEDRMYKIRSYYNLEGEVLFFLDDERNVIGMLKKKSIWYILLRAIREKVRVAVRKSVKESSSFNLQRECQRIEHRIDEIEKWLKLDDETVRDWKELGKDFLKWVIQEINDGRINPDDSVNRFPIHWKRFLAENRRTDKIYARIVVVQSLK